MSSNPPLAGGSTIKDAIAGALAKHNAPREVTRGFRNVSPTTLTLDHGGTFPPNTVAQLTDAEVARFEAASAAAQRTYIVEAAAPKQKAPAAIAPLGEKKEVKS